MTTEENAVIADLEDDEKECDENCEDCENEDCEVMCCDCCDECCLDIYEVGDVVKLASGGPLMTVTALAIEGVECTWFVEGQLIIAVIPGPALNLMCE